MISLSSFQIALVTKKEAVEIINGVGSTKDISCLTKPCNGRSRWVVGRVLGRSSK
jgi:hypothetical protein